MQNAAQICAACNLPVALFDAPVAAHRCVDCGAEIQRSLLRCHSCKRKRHRDRQRLRTREQRQASRAREANRKGKRYTPNGGRYSPEAVAARAARIVHRERLAEIDARMRDIRAELRALCKELPRYRDPKDVRSVLVDRIRHRIKKLRKRTTVTLPDGPRLICLRFGYTADELKVHVERQFSKRMNWERLVAGDIHIDHIVPARSFDLSNPDEVKRCFALTNLRPLWATENVAKGADLLTLL